MPKDCAGTWGWVMNYVTSIDTDVFRIGNGSESDDACCWDWIFQPARANTMLLGSPPHWGNADRPPAE